MCAIVANEQIACDIYRKGEYASFHYIPDDYSGIEEVDIAKRGGDQLSSTTTSQAWRARAAARREHQGNNLQRRHPQEREGYQITLAFISTEFVECGESPFLQDQWRKLNAEHQACLIYAETQPIDAERPMVQVECRTSSLLDLC